MNAASEPNWDDDLYRLYHKRLGDESWQDDFVDDVPARGEQSWSAPEETGTDYSRALFGGPGADLLGSVYSVDGADAAADQRWDTGPQSGSMPAISQPLSRIGYDDHRWDAGPQSGSMPGISEPMSPIAQSDQRWDTGPQSGSMPSISPSLPSLSSSIPSISEPGFALGGSSSGAWEESDDTGSLMRPYARTRGRTRSDYDLAIETLVSTSERGRAQTGATTAEHRSICGLCLEARSVAEIAAHLRLPLGVVRVLVGDMASLGLLLIHNSGMVVGDRPSMEFLERVLSGLRKL